MRGRNPDRCAVLALAALCVGVFGISACSLRPFATQEPASLGSLKDLVPHGDRDHFVFVWERVVEGGTAGAGLQVEHVTALETPGEFEIALSENAEATGRVHIRDDETAIVLLSEDDLTRGIRLTYDPPLPYLEAPLVPGERHASATAAVTGLDDGRPLGTLQVAQTTQVSRLPRTQSRLGTYTNAVQVRTMRHIQGIEGDVEMTLALVLVSGIGEIKSEGVVSGAPTLRRELACAIIAGKQIGDCHRLKQEMKELKRAGSTDL